MDFRSVSNQMGVTLDAPKGDLWHFKVECKVAQNELAQGGEGLEHAPTSMMFRLNIHLKKHFFL